METRVLIQSASKPFAQDWRTGFRDVKFEGVDRPLAYYKLNLRAFGSSELKTWYNDRKTWLYRKTWYHRLDLINQVLQSNSLVQIQAASRMHPNLDLLIAV